jgi:DNA segregation ATPase FtsK/SpoIIIE-like protein
LKWSVDEMERRYTMLKEKRVKNIEEYNLKII